VGKGYLIDSNAIIDFFNKSLPEKGRDLLFKIEPNISIITFIEVLAKSSANANELIEIRRFCENCKVYVVDTNIAPLAIDLRRNYRIKLPDALIAATALYKDLILITRNVSDFNKVENLEIVNPHLI
jgi:predicted nucleic acid-binding protein